jgi:ABC-type bacteriocin/lantibiotic exporter with double-glycine peptidase domain
MARNVSQHSNGAGAGHGDLPWGGHPSPFRRLYQLLLPEKEDLGTVLLFAVIAGVLYLASPLAVDVLVNSLAFGAREGVYIQALVVLTLGLFVFLCLLGLVRAAQYYVTELIQRRLFVRLTADMVYRLPRVRMDALDQKLGPDLVNRFFDMVTVQKAASLLLLDGINLVLGAFIGLLILGFYHPFLLVFDLLLLLTVGVILWGFGKGAVVTSVDESYAKHDTASWLEQVAMFPYLFKSSGGVKIAEEKADALAHEYLETRKAHYRIVFRQIVGLLFLQAIAFSTLLGVGGFLVLDGQLTLGQLVAAELIVSAIVANLASLGKHAESLYDVLAAVDKIGYVVDLPVERTSGEMPAVTTETPGASVVVEGVAFRYPGGRDIFSGLDFQLEPGRRMAVKGGPGDGTSTLMDILFGAREPHEGTVRVDGIDVRNWDLTALRSTVALVRDQDVVQGSVLDNVRFGRSEFGRSDVEAALDKVGLLEEVMRLPQQMDTVLNVGGRPLSSSQRTRLVIARAILGNPRLLLLDDNIEYRDPTIFSDLSNFLFDDRNGWTLMIASRDPSILDDCHVILDLTQGGRLDKGVAQ